MKTVFSIALITCILGGSSSKAPHEMETTQIVITVGGQEFSAELYGNPTSKSLMDQMPFTADLKDYAQTEKIFYPEEKLSIEAASKGYAPKVGDITCYGPWGNVAIFYKEHGYADGLISIGHIDDIETLVKAIETTGNKAKFELKFERK